jgi:hypothetical protein
VFEKAKDERIRDLHSCYNLTSEDEWYSYSRNFAEQENIVARRRDKEERTANIAVNPTRQIFTLSSKTDKLSV